VRDTKVRGTTIKVLLAGARYTGKGQIGREWGQTTADLPTLQPVILYDRNVINGSTKYRVVAWVISFDPEFQAIRHAFYTGAGGIIFTCSLAEEHADSIAKLDQYLGELKRELKDLPPAVLFGVTLDAKQVVYPASRDRAMKWAKSHAMPMFEGNFADKPQFALAVDQAFEKLLLDIFTIGVFKNVFKQYGP